MRWERALRRFGGCCATASSRRSIGEAGSSRFRVGKVCDFLSQQAPGMDAAADRRRTGELRGVSGLRPQPGHRTLPPG